MVEGLNINMKTNTPECPACIQGKQIVRPFKGHHTLCHEKGRITHMDLWGKYDVAFVRGNQYFLLLIDNATRYITIKFLKAKSDATQEVQVYLTHLKIRSHVTYAIKVDRGTKFINQMLQQWCNQNGIEIHATALYSPSQNGVAEHMNRTLVKLAPAMLTAAQLPEFLWEPATRHAAYIQNQSYTKVIPDKTPYQGWYLEKLNVSHLREFGSLVWILNQGQYAKCKILPEIFILYKIYPMRHSILMILHAKGSGLDKPMKTHARLKVSIISSHTPDCRIPRIKNILIKEIKMKHWEKIIIKTRGAIMEP